MSKIELDEKEREINKYLTEEIGLTDDEVNQIIDYIIKRDKRILTEAFKSIIPPVEMQGKNPDSYHEGYQDGQDIMRGKITDALKQQFNIDLEDQ
jgi:hypothetical protein